MKFIILDRDGVINYDSDEYIKSPDEWHPIPGSLEAIADLNRADYRVVIATNQSGVARGHYTLEILDKIHEKLMRELAAVGGYVDEIFFCPHHPEECCGCRKPKPGLLHQIKSKFNINFSDVFFVGDSIGDIEAARAVGCKPILVLTGNGKKFLQQYPQLKEIPHFRDLAEAVKFVVGSV